MEYNFISSLELFAQEIDDWYISTLNVYNDWDRFLNFFSEISEISND